MAHDYAESLRDDLARINAPIRLDIRYISVGRGNSHIDELKSQVPEPKKPALIISFLTDHKNEIRYGEIKHFCNRLGYICQCVNFSKQRSKQKNKVVLVSNIAKQIVNKFGFLSWWIPLDSSVPALKGKSILIIGMDVYHGRRTFSEAKNVYAQRSSIGALVGLWVNASSKAGPERTLCEIVEAQAGKELIMQKDKPAGQPSPSAPTGEAAAAREVREGPGMTKGNAFEAFVKRMIQMQGHPPDHIIVYRDGLADSQLDACRESELRQIKRASPSSKTTFLVVQKRIHTRFVVVTPSGNAGNPPPGTVISSLSHPDYEDFFLVSTSCSLSTVKPVHYAVLERDPSLTLEQLQAITYSLCHCYPNWSEAVKLPVSTQLAHKLAYLMGESKLQSLEIRDDLLQTLFYL